MRKLTLPQLERHLFAAADILRGRWERLRDEVHHNVEDELTSALAGLDIDNPAALKELGYA